MRDFAASVHFSQLGIGQPAGREVECRTLLMARSAGRGDMLVILQVMTWRWPLLCAHFSRNFSPHRLAFRVCGYVFGGELNILLNKSPSAFKANEVHSESRPKNQANPGR